jgi:U1 small nuclear ribonucleoprotein 70kDa
MDGLKIEGRRILVDVERGHTVRGWKPRRLGAGAALAHDKNHGAPGHPLMSWRGVAGGWRGSPGGGVGEGRAAKRTANGR